MGGESIDARLWDSERRDSPFSTVADIEDESCDCCGGDHDISECGVVPCVSFAQAATDADRIRRAREDMSATMDEATAQAIAEERL